MKIVTPAGSCCRSTNKCAIMCAQSHEDSLPKLMSWESCTAPPNGATSRGSLVGKAFGVNLKNACSNHALGTSPLMQQCNSPKFDDDKSEVSILLLCSLGKLERPQGECICGTQ